MPTLLAAILLGLLFILCCLMLIAGIEIEMRRRHDQRQRRR